MDVLGKLFGSANKVKLLRLFLLNPGMVFERADICKRSQMSYSALRRELALLIAIDLIKERFAAVHAPAPRGKKRRARTARTARTTRKIRGYELNPAFPFLKPLENLLSTTDVFSKTELLRIARKTGRVKLFITAGIFIQNPDSRVDVLLVGDSLRKNTVERVIRAMEAGIGKELTYAFFTTEDFLYRYNVRDKFIRDILDYAHERVIDKISLS
jgi:hypothetical protein